MARYGRKKSRYRSRGRRKRSASPRRLRKRVGIRL